MPKVSIMFPSYNHENYVEAALNSVLKQTLQDFEVIASDDCSVDGTASIIQGFRDKRIHFHQFQEHVGPTKNHKYCWKHCSGEYIALLNSDDIWFPNHLEESVAYLDSHPACGAVFSWCSEIDENGKITAKISDEFRANNRTRAEWLFRFYTRGNVLCHPSMVIRREVYDSLGFYSDTLRQLPDFDMWIRLVKAYDIHIQESIQMQFRQCKKTNGNTSAPVLGNCIRHDIESQYILSHFFEDMDDQLFIEAFSSLFQNKEARTHEQLLCEKFFLLKKDCYYVPKVSYAVAYSFFHEISKADGILRILKEEYDYTIEDYFDFAGQLDITGRYEDAKTEGSISVFVDNPNCLKNRLRALAWAIFGKNTKAYNFLRRVLLSR